MINVIKPTKKYENYEDGKTYPVVIGNRIREVDGSIIRRWQNSEPVTMTRLMYDDLLMRISNLEEEVKRLTQKL